MAKNTKEHILEVSLNLFLRKSFKAVTMKEIVEKTGLSKGAFYHYFESKDQLFVEVFKFYYSDILQQDYTQYPQESLEAFYNDFLTKKKGGLNNFSKGSNKKLTVTGNHYLLLFEAISRNPIFQQMFKEENKRELNAWVEIIGKAKRTEEIKTTLNNTVIAEMFMYMGDGNGINKLFLKSGESDKVFQNSQKLYDSLYKLLKK